jgi:hypothetical protein
MNHDPTDVIYCDALHSWVTDTSCARRWQGAQRTGRRNTICFLRMSACRECSTGKKYAALYPQDVGHRALHQIDGKLMEVVAW